MADTGDRFKREYRGQGQVKIKTTKKAPDTSFLKMYPAHCCPLFFLFWYTGNDILNAFRKGFVMLTLRSISKSFHDGESELQVLRGIDLHLEPGESVALLGASGNGKSTLLQIAAGLESPDSGEVLIMGRSLATQSEREIAMLRRRHLGFVFQQFNLLPGLDVSDNLLFQRRLNRLPPDDAWIEEISSVLGLAPLHGQTGGGALEWTATARCNRARTGASAAGFVCG